MSLLSCLYHCRGYEWQLPFSGAGRHLLALKLLTDHPFTQNRDTRPGGDHSALRSAPTSRRSGLIQRRPLWKNAIQTISTSLDALVQPKSTILGVEMSTLTCFLSRILQIISHQYISSYLSEVLLESNFTALSDICADHSWSTNLSTFSCLFF